MGFGGLLGRLVLLGNEDYKRRKDKLRVVVSDYYPNIARRTLRDDGLGQADYDLTIVEGSVEGYLSNGEYDIAVETIFSRDTLDRENQELKRLEKSSIEVIRKIIDIAPIIISDESCQGDFYGLFSSQPARKGGDYDGR
jgi:hypothetical protein